jgi:hypothetical protein
MIEATPSVNLQGPGYRAMSAFSHATHELPLDPLLREPVIVTINAWNRVAIAGHERAGEYEPA